MGDITGIEWTNHTFNPWWGCEVYGPECDNCYARTLANRWGFAIWGRDEPRRFFGDKHWNEPLKWDRDAARDGVRRRVFCASMADVFEARADLGEHRARLWRLIAATEHLDWQLLTKRPENIMTMVPESWQRGFPDHVQVGTTAGNQKMAERRVPHLLRVPALVRFLSIEPMLGPVNLDLLHCPTHDRQFISAAGHCNECAANGYDAELAGGRWLDACADREQRGINWVIVGGESGHGARPMHPDWARSLRDQCAEAGVPFFFKQWGEHAPARVVVRDETTGRQVTADAKVDGGAAMARVGKKAAGSLLDGVSHKAFPDFD
jgi:protein gp37